MTQKRSKNDMVTVRIDPEAKAKATQILAGSGLEIDSELGVPKGLKMNKEEYDAWFRAKVHEALQSDEPDCSHEEVMEEADAIIARKRNS